MIRNASKTKLKLLANIIGNWADIWLQKDVECDWKGYRSWGTLGEVVIRNPSMMNSVSSGAAIGHVGQLGKSIGKI